MPAPDTPDGACELTLTEEFALLALDDQTGKPLALPGDALGYGLAGAIILDLSLARRIDTDECQLTVIDPTPTQDHLLDTWLQRFQSAPEPKPVSFWLRTLADQQKKIHRVALDRLVERGILRREERRLLWVFGVRQYPTVDGTERTEVRTRLGQLILGKDLPTPRDAILLSLIDGCRLSEHLFVGLDLKTHKARLETLVNTDLVGREVSTATVLSLDALGRAMSQTRLGL